MTKMRRKADRLAARALDCFGLIDPRKLESARRGDLPAARVTVPWPAMIALLDEVETQYPGAWESFKSRSNEQEQEK